MQIQINQDEVIAIAAGLVLIGAAYWKGRHDEAVLQNKSRNLIMLYVLQPKFFILPLRFTSQSYGLPSEQVNKYTFVTRWGSPVRLGLARRGKQCRYGFTTDPDRTFQIHVHIGRSSVYVGSTVHRGDAHLWGGANVEVSK